jgi:hypothetical protein
MVTNLRVDGVWFTGVYEDWNAAFYDCINVTISDLYVNSGTEISEDGLHFSGGSNVAVANCVIICGDDCIAITQEGYDTVPTGTTDFVATNCYLHSKAANMVRVWVSTGDLAIRRIQFSNIVGKSGVDGAEAGHGIEILGTTGDNLVSDIHLTDFYLDAADNNGQGMILSNAWRVTLTRVVINEPRQFSSINGCVDVDLLDCVINSPRDDNMSCLLVATTADCAFVRIQGGRYTSAKHHAIVLGFVDEEDPDFEIEYFEVSSATINYNQLNGLQLVNAHHGLVQGNKIHDNGANSWGILEGSACSDNVYIANWLYDNPAGPIFFQGTDTRAVRNFAEAGTEVSDTGGFRDTVDGWTIATSATSGTEMDRYGQTPGPGTRFRAVRLHHRNSHCRRKRHLRRNGNGHGPRKRIGDTRHHLIVVRNDRRPNVSNRLRTIYRRGRAYRDFHQERLANVHHIAVLV